MELKEFVETMKKFGWINSSDVQNCYVYEKDDRGFTLSLCRFDETLNLVICLKGGYINFPLEKVRVCDDTYLVVDGRRKKDALPLLLDL